MFKISRDYNYFKVASRGQPLEVSERTVRVVMQCVFYREECDDVCSVCGFSRVGSV
jgi:hypothetical protein